jgi:hypothetical protein
VGPLTAIKRASSFLEWRPWDIANVQERQIEEFIWGDLPKSLNDFIILQLYSVL